MTAPAELPVASPAGELGRLFAAQRAAFARERYPDYPVRRDRLQRLLRIVTDDEAALCAAVTRDFGHRSTQETRLAELYIVAAGHGKFRVGDRVDPIRPGALLYVAAHEVHRFEDFSDDFAVWVVFYGPVKRR